MKGRIISAGISGPRMVRLNRLNLSFSSSENCTICGEPVLPSRADSTHPTCSDMDEPTFKRLQLWELGKLAARFPGFVPALMALADALVRYS